MFGKNNTAKLRRLLAVFLAVALTGMISAAEASFLPAGTAVSAIIDAGETEIIIDTDRKMLTYYDAGELKAESPVAVGKTNTPTPLGEWKIAEKSSGWGGGFGTRWLGLNVPWGIYGIHGTNKPWSIGRQASAGCIRMNNRDVEQLFEMVRIGTPVRIIGERKFTSFRVVFRRGSAGQDVVYLQMRLRESGFPAGAADGRFGPDTERAVRELQIFYGFSGDGVVNQNTQCLLNLK